MATVPVTRTWVAGEVVTAAYMNNNVTAVMNWLLAPAICQVRSIVSQSIASGSTTPIDFGAEDVDTTGMHSTVSNISFITAVYPGWYQCSGAVSYAANVTGRRIALFRLNSIDITASFAAYQTTATSVCITPSRTMLVFLNVGDILQLAGQHSAGAAVSTVVSAADQPNCTVIWQSN